MDYPIAHDHAHHHSVSPTQAGSRVFIIGIFLNLAYVVAETIAGLWTHSLSLLTDAGHNLSDVASLTLSLIALRLAKLKPTDNFTYGYKKSTVLAALINAVILLIAIGILGYEAVHRIHHPEPIKGGTVAWVAGLSIIINSVSAFLFFRDKHELNARGAYLHLLADAMVSVGVVIAGIIISYTAQFWLDTVVSLIVLVVILISTWTLLTDSIRLSLDGVPTNVNLDEVRSAMRKVAGVTSVSHIDIWAMSTTENAFTAHITMSPNITDQHSIIAEIRHELKHANIQHATIEIDRPEDVQRDSRLYNNPIIGLFSFPLSIRYESL